MADKTCLGVTPGGKHLYAINKPNRSVMELYFNEGGDLPRELSGAFSDRSTAQVAVDQYLAKPFAKSKKK